MAATLGLLASASSGSAQQAPRPLPAPDVTFSEPFSSIGVGALRELRDGRVIVADPRDKVISLVDLRSGSATPIGREGGGPQEFGMPMRVLGAPGDTTFVYDPLNSRYLIIGADGKPINTFRTENDPAAGPPPARDGAAPGRQVPGPGGAPGAAGAPRGAGGPVLFSGGGLIARTSDALGRLYGESIGFSIGPNGQPQQPDSAAIVRFDRATRRVDTLAYIALPKQNTQISGSGGNVSFRIGGANPLLPRDEWTVFPDGLLAIVRASDYHVDWVAPNGRKSSSAPIRYTPVRMNAAEIRHEEELRNRARANQMSIAVTNDGGGTRRSAQMGPPPGAPPLEPLTDWPEVKPPFRSGPASVLARPNGELWVRRTEPGSAKGTLYDVINQTGVVTHQVRVPEGTTLVGFGNGTAYTTKLDEDDLVYLQRHKL